MEKVDYCCLWWAWNWTTYFQVATVWARVMSSRSSLSSGEGFSLLASRWGGKVSRSSICERGKIVTYLTLPVYNNPQSTPCGHVFCVSSFVCIVDWTNLAITLVDIIYALQYMQIYGFAHHHPILHIHSPNKEYIYAHTQASHRQTAYSFPMCYKWTFLSIIMYNLLVQNFHVLVTPNYATYGKVATITHIQV